MQLGAKFSDRQINLDRLSSCRISVRSATTAEAPRLVIGQRYGAGERVGGGNLSAVHARMKQTKLVCLQGCVDGGAHKAEAPKDLSYLPRNS